MSASLDLLRAKSVQARTQMLTVIAELSDEQLGWRPSPKAHSIGFTLWHTARADDNVQADLTGGPLLWESGGYAARWGHPERGVGTGWDDDRAAALPLPPKRELIEYVTRVFAAVDLGTGTVDDARFELPIQSRFRGTDSTYGEVMLVCLSHDNRHLGEMEYIKGLLGLRGTATR